jgi:hypothetical protein
MTNLKATMKNKSYIRTLLHITFHEAGHAVLARLQDLEFEYVVADGKTNHVYFPPGMLCNSEKSIIVLYGGFRAQGILRKRMDAYFTSFSNGDFIKAKEQAQALWGDGDQEKNLRRLSLKAKKLIDKPNVRAAIQATASALRDRMRLTAAEVDQIIHRTSIGHYE